MTEGPFAGVWVAIGYQADGVTPDGIAALTTIDNFGHVTSTPMVATDRMDVERLKDACAKLARTTKRRVELRYYADTGTLAGEWGA